MSRYIVTNCPARCYPLFGSRSVLHCNATGLPCIENTSCLVKRTYEQLRRNICDGIDCMTCPVECDRNTNNELKNIVKEFEVKEWRC